MGIKSVKPTRQCLYMKTKHSHTYCWLKIFIIKRASKGHCRYIYVSNPYSWGALSLLQRNFELPWDGKQRIRGHLHVHRVGISVDFINVRHCVNGFLVSGNIVTPRNPDDRN